MSINVSGADLFWIGLDTQLQPTMESDDRPVSRCPDCSEECPAKADFCPFCGGTIDWKRKLDVSYDESIWKRYRLEVILAVCGAIFLPVLFGFLYYRSSIEPKMQLVPTGTNATSTLESNTVTPPLEVTSWSWRQSFSPRFVDVEGEVRNVSDEPIERIMVSIEFRDKDGTFITSLAGMVDYAPLLPLQSSTFKTTGLFTSDMQNARLRFRTIRGVEIPYTDVSKPKIPSSKTKNR